MSVLINSKICDNSSACGGIQVCPTGALSYDTDQNTIIVSPELCIRCGLCVSQCPVGAIKVAQSIKEFEALQSEINNDTRTTTELFIDRYGAEIIESSYYLDPNIIEEYTNNSNDLVFLEIYTEDSINCMLYSIPISHFIKTYNCDFKKIEATENIIEKYQLTEFPSLLIFNKGVYIGKVDGYYDLTRINEFQNQINGILVGC